MSTDNEQQRKISPPETKSTSAVVRWLGRIVRLLLILAILGAGGWVSYQWLTNRPKTKRRQTQGQATLVEVRRIKPQTKTVVVRAMGTVVPARVIQLASRVSGQVVKVSPKFVPGGYFSANEQILQVEPKDYELAVRQSASTLAKARCDLEVEMGQQSVSRREYELLGKDVRPEDKALLLRKPQLAMARAAVSAAEAALKKAQLDLQRTKITAPFNATVQSRNIDLGSQAALGAPLASLVDTDEYWIQVLIPTDQLKWISIPGPTTNVKGSAAGVYHASAWGAGVFRTAVVRHLMTDLEPQGRMARLLVAVKDPLSLKPSGAKSPPVILGAYVRVEIDGKKLANVTSIPRSALRNGNQVWIMKPDATLDIRKVNIVFSGNDCVYIRNGLNETDLLITSDIATPTGGMTLRLAPANSNREQPQ